MRYLESHYPEGGFAADGAPAGEFVFPDFPISGASTRWFIGVPSFKKCQYAIVADDGDKLEGFIDDMATRVRDYYPGIPASMLNQMITTMLLAITREDLPVGRVLRVFVEADSAKLQPLDDELRFIDLWTDPIFGKDVT